MFLMYYFKILDCTFNLMYWNFLVSRAWAEEIPSSERRLAFIDAFVTQTQ